MIPDCCITCAGCGLPWCRDNDISPGETSGICRDCYETESEYTDDAA